MNWHKFWFLLSVGAFIVCVVLGLWLHVAYWLIIAVMIYLFRNVEHSKECDDACNKSN